MRRTLIIEIKKGGLGDHLFYSHIPRIAKITNTFDFVLISNRSIFRNPDYKKLIWELNPYVDGFTNEEGVFHFSTYFNEDQNMLDSIMLMYGLDDNERFHEPEIYYNPNIKMELSGQIIFDPNYISYTGDIKSNQLIKKWLFDNKINIDFEMQILSKRFIKLDSNKFLQAKNIFDFCDILISIDSIYCFTTGTATLATALKKRANVFYGKGHQEGYRHSKNNNYIYLGTDYNKLDKIKTFIFHIFHKLKEVYNN